MQTEKRKQDGSVGVIPVYVDADGTRLFCVVRHAAGHWAFPKGHQDEGESEEETARRELWEETGINAIDLDTSRTFSEVYSFQRDGIHYEKHVRYFVGFADSTTQTTPDAFKTEISELRWLIYGEAKNLLTFPQAKALLDEVQVYLESRV